MYKYSIDDQKFKAIKDLDIILLTDLTFLNIFQLFIEQTFGRVYQATMLVHLMSKNVILCIRAFVPWVSVYLL